MLGGLWLVLKRRRKVFRLVFLAALLLGLLLLLYHGRASVATATLQLSQPLEKFPALDDQFAALFSRYLERFRQVAAQAEWLAGHGLHVGPAYLQEHVVIVPEVRDGCRFHLRVSGPRPGFVLLVTESLIRWHLEESARLLQEHVLEMRRFQENRLAAVLAESRAVRQAMAALNASLQVKSISEALSGIGARLRRLQASLASTESARRKLLARLQTARRALERSAGVGRRRPRRPDPREMRAAQAWVRELSDRLTRLDARKVAIKRTILGVSKLRLQLTERQGEYDELRLRQEAFDAAAGMWERKRDFTLLQERTGVGRLTLTAGPRLVDEGFSLFRPEAWLGVLALSLAFGLVSVVLADYLDTTVRSPFFLPRVRAFGIRGRIPEVMMAEGGAAPSLDAPDFPGDPLLPGTAATGALSSLRDQVLASLDRKPFESLTILAPDAGAGASTLLAGLGIALARSGRKVLLIDADLRQPGLHRRFFQLPVPGLTSWSPGRPFEPCCRPTGFPGLQIAPPGLPPPDIERFWQSEDRAREVLAAARCVADLVLVDLPPLSAGMECRPFLPFIDRILVLAGVGRTQVREVQALFEQLGSADLEPAGILYNRIPPGEMDFLWTMV